VVRGVIVTGSRASQGSATQAGSKVDECPTFRVPRLVLRPAPPTVQHRTTKTNTMMTNDDRRTTLKRESFRCSHRFDDGSRCTQLALAIVVDDQDLLSRCDEHDGQHHD
jgi:hypothetical protein